MININCKHILPYYRCGKKPKVFFGLFKQMCCEMDIWIECSIAERYPRPERPSVRILKESGLKKKEALIR